MDFRRIIEGRYHVVADVVDTLRSKFRASLKKKKTFETWISNEKSSSDNIYHKLNFDPKDDDFDKAEFEEAAKEEYESLYESFLYDFTHTADTFENKLYVYRCISVDDLEEFMETLRLGRSLPKYKGIGIFWSWDKDKAECHWGSGSQTVTVTGLVPLNSIDVEHTAFLNIVTLTGPDEAEIRLKPGVKVQVVHVEGPNDFYWEAGEKDLFVAA